MPALIESEHPACAHLIRRYLLCSRTAPLLGKIFLSQCTTEKYQLDACFREEKAKRTKKNIEKAKVLKQNLQDLRRERRHNKLKGVSDSEQSSTAQ